MKRLKSELTIQGLQQPWLQTKIQIKPSSRQATTGARTHTHIRAHAHTADHSQDDSSGVGVNWRSVVTCCSLKAWRMVTLEAFRVKRTCCIQSPGAHVGRRRESAALGFLKNWTVDTRSPSLRAKEMFSK